MCRYSDSLEEKLLPVTQRLGCSCFLVNHSTMGPKSSSEDQRKFVALRILPALVQLSGWRD